MLLYYDAIVAEVLRVRNEEIRGKESTNLYHPVFTTLAMYSFTKFQD